MKTRILVFAVVLLTAGCASRPKVRPMSPETRAEIERAVREMREAARTVTFP